MPTIVIASPKGGAGKSTTAVILGTELAYRGVPTVLLDCDPNRSISRWARKGHMPPRVKLENEITEASVIKVIRSHDIDGQVVIVDLESGMPLFGDDDVDGLIERLEQSELASAPTPMIVRNERQDREDLQSWYDLKPLKWGKQPVFNARWG